MSRLSWAILCALLALPLATSFQPTLDPDTWWHLRVGQWVQEHQGVPTTDPFSRLGISEHRAWQAYSWLHGYLLERTDSLAGPKGIIPFRVVLNGLVLLATIGFVGCRVPDPAQRLLLLAALVVIFQPFMNERPWNYTILGVLLTLDAMHGLGEGRWSWQVAALPVVYCVWANLHIQFVLGLGLLGLGCGLRYVAGYPVRNCLKMLLLCGLATLVNPYHAGLWQVVWEYATQTTALRHVLELQPPDGRHPAHWATLILVALAARRVAWRPDRWSGFLVLALGLLFAARMQRDIWFAAILAVTVWHPGGFYAVPSGEDPNSDRSKQACCPFLWKGLTCVVLTLFAIGFLRGSSLAQLDASLASRYPVQACRFVRQHEFAGPLFNDFNWGGYLIWALPGYPVVIDGRTNLYGEARLQRSIRTWAGDPGWQNDPDLKTARLVIAPRYVSRSDRREVGLVTRLRDCLDWKVAYQDGVAVVFLRRTQS